MDYDTSQDSAHSSRSTTPDQEIVREPTMDVQQEQYQSAASENSTDEEVFEAPSGQISRPAQTGASIPGLPAALGREISQLLSEDQLAVMQGLFQNYLPTPNGNPEIPGNGCPLLNRIPIECRKQIWEYLLYSPILGECVAVDSIAMDNMQVKYDLFPAILRANKQTYNEGMDILYGQNTFLIECIPHEAYDHGIDRVSFCALTRTQQIERINGVREGDKSIIPAAKHVQHWKVVLSAILCEHDGDNGLLSFCRNICMANIRSLEILIIPRGIEQDHINDGDEYGDEFQLTVTLSPLECLRNVQRCVIRPAELHEIPRYRFDSDEWLTDDFTPILPDPVDEVRLVTLIEGNSEIERIEGMYKNLLSYAQSFERIEEFRMDMSIDEEVFRSNSTATIEYDVGFPPSINPFKSNNHPVENGLGIAKTAMIEHNIEWFKSRRSVIIQYFEPQYQAIEAASKNIVDFIKFHKTENGFFDASNRSYKDPVDTATEAIVLLEDYAASFARKLEAKTKFAIRKQKLLFNARYEALPREQAMKFCEMAYEKQWWNRFVHHFKEAVDDMDTQYLAIREARKKLYAWDLQATVREVDIKPMLCDEMINWNICEKDMRINEEGKPAYRFYPEDYTNVDLSEFTTGLNDHNDQYDEAAISSRRSEDGDTRYDANDDESELDTEGSMQDETQDHNSDDTGSGSDSGESHQGQDEQ